ADAVGARAARRQAGNGVARAAPFAEAFVEELRSLDRALGPGDRAEHDGDQRAPPAVGDRHDVETRGADIAGLHAADAGIAPDEAVGVVEHLLAELDGGRVPVV